MSELEAFGKTSVSANSQMSYLLRFPGQWEDGIGGVNYNNERNYVSESGRFTQIDRIGIGDGLNIFSFSWANPTRYFDASGLDVVPLGSCNGNRGIVTCNGIGGFEPRWCPTHQCLANCIYEHEASHVEDWQRDFPKNCRGKPRGMILYEAEEWIVESECKAYIVSINCLKKQLARNESCKCDENEFCICPEGVLEKELAFHLNQFYFENSCDKRGYSL